MARQTMTIRRAALHIGGASLLVAWLASAASVSRQEPEPVPPAPAIEPSVIDGVAADVETQARRLKARLAAPAVSQPPTRNPFAFREVARRAAQPPVRPIELPILTAPEPARVEPTMQLIGVAEQRKPQGLVRTAMLAVEGDQLIMAVVGDVVMLRFKVTAIDADAVELTEETTGAARRLVLQER